MIFSLHRVSALRGVLRNPRATREEVVEYQNRQLRCLIAHAYENVLYYRKLFDRHGLKPKDIQSVADLPAVPITTRRELQELPTHELVAGGVDPEQLIPSSSSGSSGQPLTVRRTWFEERLHNAFRWRALRSHGLRATDVHCYVMVARSDRRRDNRILQHAAQAIGLGRYVVVGCLQSPEEIVATLRKIRPDVVSGYAGVLARISQTIDPSELRSLRLCFVGTAGEVLTPLMRAQIEEGFAAPVYQTYGSIEFNLLAWQCIQTDEFHVCDDGMILEIVQGDKPVTEDESGEVVGTDLHSFAMPIIRYRLGDVVTKGSESCRCGQPFSAIRAIRGRMNDYFQLPGGRLVHPSEVTRVTREKTPWIREFQITQERMDRIVMRVVPFYQPSSRELAVVQNPATALLGPEARFEVELVSEIQLEPSGKYRVYRSMLSSAYDEISLDHGGTRCGK
jgi:phenylacetate-coenzyme A ligase PaaK-like adenylate-forming protein